MTTEQEAALNRAIAGYDDNSSCEFYTKSLDAIVPVVQKWMNNLIGSRERFYDLQDGLANYRIFTTNRLIMNERPALALCIAFAKAAGLEWEKDGK